jgi:hypothetical protein
LSLTNQQTKQKQTKNIKIPVRTTANKTGSKSERLILLIATIADPPIISLLFFSASLSWQPRPQVMHYCLARVLYQ